MHRKILILGLAFAALSVLLGAFGAHALKAMVKYLIAGQVHKRKDRRQVHRTLP